MNSPQLLEIIKRAARIGPIRRTERQKAVSEYQEKELERSGKMMGWR